MGSRIRLRGKGKVVGVTNQRLDGRQPVVDLNHDRPLLVGRPECDLRAGFSKPRYLTIHQQHDPQTTPTATNSHAGEAG